MNTRKGKGSRLCGTTGSVTGGWDAIEIESTFGITLARLQIWDVCEG